MQNTDFFLPAPAPLAEKKPSNASVHKLTTILFTFRNGHQLKKEIRKHFKYLHLVNKELNVCTKLYMFI